MEDVLIIWPSFRIIIVIKEFVCLMAETDNQCNKIYWDTYYQTSNKTSYDITELYDCCIKVFCESRCEK